MQKLEELDILDHHREIIVKIWKANLYTRGVRIQLGFANVLWVAFSIPSGSLPLVKYPVCVANY
jgi:hypothetical protein